MSIPGLAEAVASCEPDANHAGLLQAVRRFEGLENVRLIHVEGIDGSMSSSSAKSGAAPVQGLADLREGPLRQGRREKYVIDIRVDQMPMLGTRPPAAATRSATAQNNSGSCPGAGGTTTLPL